MKFEQIRNATIVLEYADKKFLVDNTRQKLKAVLGDKGGDAVIDETEQAYKLNQNANSVLSGSQTAEKQGMRDRLQGLRRLVCFGHSFAVVRCAAQDAC